MSKEYPKRSQLHLTVYCIFLYILWSSLWWSAPSPPRSVTVANRGGSLHIYTKSLELYTQTLVQLEIYEWVSSILKTRRSEASSVAHWCCCCCAWCHLPIERSWTESNPPTSARPSRLVFDAAAAICRMSCIHDNLSMPQWGSTKT